MAAHGRAARVARTLGARLRSGATTVHRLRYGERRLLERAPCNVHLHGAVRRASSSEPHATPAASSWDSPVLLFPGQGTQYVGMCKDVATEFAVARHVLEEVDEALQERLSLCMFEGDHATLTNTANAQPAILAHSIAMLEVLKAEGVVRMEDVRSCAGHSVGQFAALVAAGSLTLADAARLLRLRGRAMQDSVAGIECAMAALLPAEEQAVEAALRDLPPPQSARERDWVVDIAAVNGPAHVVISGNAAAVKAACEYCKQHRVARRATLLDVSAAFHSRLLEPAASALRAALDEVELAPPLVPVMSNVTGVAMNTSGEQGWHASATLDLVEQVTARVRWSDNMTCMRDGGSQHFLELGPGQVLAGLAKPRGRGAADVHVASVGDVLSVRSWVSAR